MQDVEFRFPNGWYRDGSPTGASSTLVSAGAIAIAPGVIATLKLKVKNRSEITSASGWMNESQLTFGSETGGSLALDTDGDEWTDIEEYEEETDPNDPTDYPSTGGLPVWLLYQATQ